MSDIYDQMKLGVLFGLKDLSSIVNAANETTNSGF